MNVREHRAVIFNESSVAEHAHIQLRVRSWPASAVEQHEAEIAGGLFQTML